MISSEKECVKVARYNASMSRLWDEFIAGCKNATFLFRRDYIDYNPRLNDFSLLFYKGDKLAGVLPASIDGDTLASHAGLTYGGFLLPRGATTVDVLEMFAALRGYLRENTSVKKIIYKPVPHIYATYPAEEDLYALFRQGAVLVERRISSVVQLRDRLPFSVLRGRKVKKAQKASFFIVSDENFASFWEVLKENLHKQHNSSPVHSIDEIELLASRFPDNIKLFRVVDEQGVTVAGAVLYITHKVAHVQYIGSVQKGRDNGALDYLFDYLVGEKYAEKEFFDFGTSVEQGGYILNEGLIFQKEGFGGRAVVYDTYFFGI